MNPSCPDATEYEQFLEEVLPPSRQHELVMHLETCVDCQHYLEQRTQPTDERLVDILSQENSTIQRLTGRSQDTEELPNGSVMLRRPITGPPGYEILEELGRGGMGVVYKARQKRLGRLVALKMILAAGHATPVHVLRFLREAELIAKLRHPNIVQVHEVGQHEGQPFLALEYVEGGTLASQLQSTGAPLSPRTAAALVEQLARAVQYAHQQGVVHRDLKPSNILVQPSNGCPVPWTPKISDFGLAKELQAAEGLTPTYTAMGTPQYMAPEQARGDTRTAGPAADVYALGAILYELLAGRPPFLGSDPIAIVLKVVSEEVVPLSRIRRTIPLDLATICMKCLEKEPGKRYPSADALAEDLRRFLEGRPIVARPVSERKL